MEKLLIATNNAGKVREIENFLADLPLELLCLNDFSHVVEPEETGATFVENAVLKAREYALQTGAWSLADDSGLEVEALNGAPGVLSARYAGKNADDRTRIEKLLDEVEETEDRNRRARFVCAMAIADENGEIKFTTEGVCAGAIAPAPVGENGFGYDPIFIPDGFSETFGELSGDIKSRLSHRRAAIDEIIQYLRRIYAASV